MPTYIFIAKVGVAALVIAFASWLSEKKPELAGFIIALPIASILALAFSYMEYKDTAAAVTFAKSIFIAIPISYVFFLPFFLWSRLGWSFWPMYSVGLLLLVAGYLVHKLVIRHLI